MDDIIVNAIGLKKTYKVSVREKSSFLHSLKSLFKPTYKYVDAVKNIDFKITKGEIRGLIGPNGAGKSTIIKMLCGVLYPTEGDINCLGFKPWKEREDYVRHIGVVFGQKSQLWWNLPPIDAFYLNKKLYRIPEHKFKNNLDMFINLLKLETVISKPTRQLSLGERMKCEFVAALLHEPGLVLLDEPTIGLDIIAKEAIRDFIKKVNMENKITFLITTHDLSDIEDLCKNVTIINHGSMVFDDQIFNLNSAYTNKKVINIKLKHQLHDENWKENINCVVINSDASNISLEFDTKEIEIKDVLAQLWDVLPIHDLNIVSYPIEKLIKEIYNQ
ncbi:MAG: ATP-binding cassette domain-containing protein [Alphaproteobacteria bacterium]|nr:MAG: ATP-binding cassette domain-containing protein [Alphaproteobacteria bacterium]